MPTLAQQIDAITQEAFDAELAGLEDQEFLDAKEGYLQRLCALGLTRKQARLELMVCY